MKWIRIEGRVLPFVRTVFAAAIILAVHPAQAYVTASDVAQGAESAQAAQSAQSAQTQAVEAAEAQNTETAGGAVMDAASDACPGEPVGLDESWQWASNSAIHTGQAMLYRYGGSLEVEGRKNITVCVNAGHGCSGGESCQTLSHPDGTPKVTGGTSADGAVYSTSISSGMAFADGSYEAQANLLVAMSLKNMLLSDGYDVLMIRESDDVQLDNIARTVIANNCADLHVAIHFDGTTSGKGAYFMSVPDNASYRSMEPVASHWEEHNALGRALVEAFSRNGYALFDGGELQMDLTQTSYSTIPSVDIEVGDGISDHSEQACEGYALALKEGIDAFVQSGTLR